MNVKEKVVMIDGDTHYKLKEMSLKTGKTIKSLVKLLVNAYQDGKLKIKE